jgi:hypothetical protein
MLATIIDLDALWKILLAAFAVGVGLTSVFGAGALALERLTAARHESADGSALANGAIVATAALACLAAVGLGMFAITHK